MKCLTKACTRQEAADMKGLCIKCYSSAKKLVTAGATTWEDLEEKGLARLKEDEFLKQFKQGEK